MANKIQTITAADILVDGKIRGYIKVEWDEAGTIDPEDTQTKSKVFDDYASCPQVLKDFITARTA